MWLDLAHSATSADAEPVAHVRALAAVALAMLCARACRWSDTRRLVVSTQYAAGTNAVNRALATVAAVLDSAADSVDDELFAYWSLALSVLLRAAPAAARGLADRLERALLRALGAPHSAAKRHCAAACLALLPAAAHTRVVASGAGDEIVTASAATAVSDAYALLALRLIALAHDSLDVLFAAVVEPSESDALRVEPGVVGVHRALLGEMPEESGVAADVLSHRFAALCDTLSLLYRVEPPADVASRRRLPLRACVALALRVIGVGSVIQRNVRVRRGANQLDGVPLLSRHDVTAVLPALHSTALELLAVLTQAVGTRMLSYVDVVGEATLAALARSATPRASVAANAAMSLDATAVAGGTTDGAEVYNEEAAKAALLHAPTRPLAYEVARRLLRMGGAGLADRTFLAPLLAHAVCDIRPLEDLSAVATDAGAGGAKKRKRAKASDAAASANGGGKTTIDVSLRDHVSEQARRAAMRVVGDALLHAPLALTNVVKRSCAQAVIDVAARDLLSPQVQQSGMANENTASSVVSHARAEAAAMRVIVVETLDVLVRRVPAAAAVSRELLQRLAHDPVDSVSLAAQCALLREVHIESAIIKVAEAALSVSATTVLINNDNDDDEDGDDDDEEEDDEDDGDDENQVPADVQDVANDIDLANDDVEFERRAEIVTTARVEDVGEAPYEEVVDDPVVAADDAVEAIATMTTTTTTTTTTAILIDAAADSSVATLAEDAPILKRSRVETTTTAVTRNYASNHDDDDSDSISLPDIVVQSPDEEDLL